MNEKARPNSRVTSLAAWYDRHRKKVNDNIGLVVALIAALAAVFTGYVAEKQRKEAFDAAQRSLALQQKSVEAQLESVNAQIKAQQFSIAPFLNIVPLGKPELDGRDLIYKFDVVSVGQYPAVMPTLFGACGTTKQVNQLAVGEDFDLRIVGHYFLVGGIGNFLFGKSARHIACSATLGSDDSEGNRMYWEAEYDDVFGNHYTGRHCFEAYLPKSKKDTIPVACSNFVPTFIMTKASH